MAEPVVSESAHEPIRACKRALRSLPSLIWCRHVPLPPALFILPFNRIGQRRSPPKIIMFSSPSHLLPRYWRRKMRLDPSSSGRTSPALGGGTIVFASGLDEARHGREEAGMQRLEKVAVGEAEAPVQLAQEKLFREKIESGGRIGLSRVRITTLHAVAISDSPHPRRTLALFVHFP